MAATDMALPRTRLGKTSEQKSQPIGPIASPKAAIKTIMQAKSAAGSVAERLAKNIQPINPRASVCTAVPKSRGGRRPALSTMAIAAIVASTLTSPTQADAEKAEVMSAPAALKILVE